MNTQTKAMLIAMVGAFSNTGLWAQGPADKPKPVITVDGAQEPHRIPDWILWRELLRVAAHLADASPTGGQEIWMGRLGLSANEMNQTIVRGRAFQAEELATDQQAKSLVGNRGRAPSEEVAKKLRQLQADREKRILEHRELLRTILGDHVVNRMHAWARQNISPAIKIGELFPGPDSAGAPAGPPPQRP